MTRTFTIVIVLATTSPVLAQAWAPPAGVGSVDVFFLVTSKLSARGMVLWQHTHGGLRFGAPPPADLPPPGDVNTPDLLYQHDRLLRDNNWRLGGSASYSFSQMDVFASYIQFVAGTDSHAGHAFTIGVSVPFDLGRTVVTREP